MKIGKIFGLDRKWFRVVLTLSIVGLGIMWFIPQEISKSEESQPIVMKGMMPEIAVDSTKAFIPDSLQHRISRQPANEAIHIQIVTAAQPFDWKGLITWSIGVLNGLILVILNIKNILKKK